MAASSTYSFFGGDTGGGSTPTNLSELRLFKNGVDLLNTDNEYGYDPERDHQQVIVVPTDANVVTLNFQTAQAIDCLAAMSKLNDLYNAGTLGFVKDTDSGKYYYIQNITAGAHVQLVSYDADVAKSKWWTLTVSSITENVESSSVRVIDTTAVWTDITKCLTDVTPVFLEIYTGGDHYLLGFTGYADHDGYYFSAMLPGSSKVLWYKLAPDSTWTHGEITLDSCKVVEVQLVKGIPFTIDPAKVMQLKQAIEDGNMPVLRLQDADKKYIATDFGTYSQGVTAWVPHTTDNTVWRLTMNQVDGSIEFRSIPLDGPFLNEVGTADYDFTDPNFDVNKNPFASGNTYVLTDWDTTWAAKSKMRLLVKKECNDVVVRFVNAEVNENGAWDIEVVDTDGSVYPSAVDTTHPNVVTALSKGVTTTIIISNNKWYAFNEVADASSLVTDAQLQAALQTLKSRIIYTLPLGAIDKVEKLKTNSDNVRIHATLFNPNMDQDLNSNSNVVLNFGPTYTYITNGMCFAIYEFDRVNRVFKWVANTSDISNQNVQGLMHFPLTYINSNYTKLKSEHLYIFCLFVNSSNDLEVMGNELLSDIGLNSQSLALVCGKQNGGTYNSAAQLGTDFATLDLTTFSEAEGHSSDTGKPARIFAAITNLTNLP